jgi:hypothetical protein
MTTQQFPAPCERCSDHDWVYAANGGVERCNCPRGRAFSDADLNRGRPRTETTPGISPEQAVAGVLKLAALISFVPASDIARLAIASQLQAFVCDADELEWLVREAARHFRTWPAMMELRALYCSRYEPRDGLSAALAEEELPKIPEAYPKVGLLGAPNPAVQALVSGIAAERLSGRAGERAITAPLCERCRDHGWVLSSSGRRYVACNCESGRALPANLLDMMNGVKPARQLPPLAIPITQADVERAVEEHHGIKKSFGCSDASQSRDTRHGFSAVAGRADSAGREGEPR